MLHAIDIGGSCSTQKRKNQDNETLNDLSAPLVTKEEGTMTISNAAVVCVMYTI